MHTLAIPATAYSSEEPKPGPPFHVPVTLSKFRSVRRCNKCSMQMLWSKLPGLELRLSPCEGFSSLPSPPRNPDALPSHDALEPAAPPNLCGIDHEALNKQIMEYKRKKEKGLPCLSLAPPSGREQAPDLTHLLRRRKKPSSRRHQDSSPRSFLLGEEDEDEEDSTTEYECQAHGAEEEWEAEARGDGLQQGLCDKREQG